MADPKMRLNAETCAAILKKAGLEPGTPKYRRAAQTWFEPSGDQNTYYARNHRAIAALKDMPETKT
jgi:hypothetical protein